MESLKYAKKHRPALDEGERSGTRACLTCSSEPRPAVEYQPKGVVGIIGTWNFPINTIVLPVDWRARCWATG